MDEYKKYYYHSNPPAQYVSYGDITERLMLKKALNCKPFKWYMDNVYPELKIPDDYHNGGNNNNNNIVGGDYVMELSKHGSLRQYDQCLDTMGNGNLGRLSMYQCHGQGANQDWIFTIDHLLKQDQLCVTVTGLEPTRPVILSECADNDSQVITSSFYILFPLLYT